MAITSRVQGTRPRPVRAGPGRPGPYKGTEQFIQRVGRKPPALRNPFKSALKPLGRV